MNIVKNFLFFILVMLFLPFWADCSGSQEAYNSEIEWIKKKYSEINNNLDKFKLVKDCSLPGIYPEREPFEFLELGEYFSGYIKIERWYQDQQLLKVGTRFEGGKQNYRSEYYYHNKQLFFAYKQWVDFENPPGSIHFNPKNKKIYEDRFYFRDKKLIQWIDRNKKNRTSTDTDFKKKENEILSDADYYQEAFVIEQYDTCAGKQEPSVELNTPSSSVKNMENDPAIVKTRTMVQKIEKGIDLKKITIKQRKFPYCTPYQDTNRRLFQNEKKQVVKYVKEGGSDDSARTVTCYYDDKGKIFFVFITAGAVNGSHLEHRIYFDETGKRLWETQKYISGPGYTFPEIWEDEDLVFHPLKEFASEVKCDEEE